MTKTCSMCKEDKPLTVDYFATRKNKGGWQSNCKICQKEYRKEHYQKNRQKYIDKAQVWNHNQRLKVIEYLRTHPCVDCNESDLRVLEFDHDDPTTKLFNISDHISSVSWPRLMKEIEKCSVRCANCHKKRTASQFNWLKNVDMA